MNDDSIRVCIIRPGKIITGELIAALTDEFLSRRGTIPQDRADHIVDEFQPQPQEDDDTR